MRHRLAVRSRVIYACARHYLITVPRVPLTPPCTAGFFFPSVLGPRAIGFCAVSGSGSGKVGHVRSTQRSAIVAIGVHVKNIGWRRSVMHAVMRSYSGKGTKALFDLLEKNKGEVESLIRGVKGFVSYSLVRTT